MIQYRKNNLTVFQSSLYATTSSIIQSDDAIILTDPNWLPIEVQAIKDFVNEMKGNKQLYIIYTHSDFDHIIGSGAFPDAKIIASEKFVNNSHAYKENKIQKIRHFDQGYYLHRDYIPEYPSVDLVVSRDGQQINIGTMCLTFYMAPGHSDDSLFTVIDNEIFLSGDYLSDVEFPFIFSSYKDYVETMDKVESILDNHHIKVQVPGHGSTTEDHQEIKDRLDFSKYYLDQLLHENNELENQLREKYPFYEGIKSIHFDNKKIAYSEMTKNN